MMLMRGEERVTESHRESSFEFFARLSLSLKNTHVVKEKMSEREREREKFLRGKKEKTSDDDESAPRGVKKKKVTRFSLNDRRHF